MAKLYPYNLETQLLALTAIQQSIEEVKSPNTISPKRIQDITKTLTTQAEAQSFYTACVSLSIALMVDVAPLEVLKRLITTLSQLYIRQNEKSGESKTLNVYNLALALAEAQSLEEPNNISNNIIGAIPDESIPSLAVGTVELAYEVLRKLDLLNEELSEKMVEARMGLLSELNSPA